MMARIFGPDTVYAPETLEVLKTVMMLAEQEETQGYGSALRIYGKTGMGKTQGIVVDAWYTGFAEKDGRNLYFCVYLGRSDGENVSSARARDIAVRILSDC